MADVITLEGNYYILATSSIADETTRVLKYGNSFAIFDKHGDMRPLGFENHGLYHDGTRYLSRWVLRLNDKTPTLLSSRVEGDNAFLSVDLANPDFKNDQGLWTPPDLLHVGRSIFLWKESHFERVKLENYSQRAITFTITVQYEADFVDIFEVRGLRREQRGEQLEPEFEDESINLRYRGLDG
ncbi:MAG: glycogen debranching N-terminal domain-containing protein, partial [Candidatus Hydrogenedentales bacterium]